MAYESFSLPTLEIKRKGVIVVKKKRNVFKKFFRYLFGSDCGKRLWWCEERSSFR
jgi:hypothetical protein